MSDGRGPWTAAAVLVFVVVGAATFGPIWRDGIHRVVPTPAGMPETFVADLRIHVARVASNARAFWVRPTRFFEAELCHPARHSLALGEPMITHAVVGAPAYLATRDPVVTYNVMLVALTLVAALAMYWLVSEWTAVPAAGIVAGLLYAFHAFKLAHTVHPFGDMSWTLFAMLFARRWFAEGRWRDAGLLGAAGALQVASSFYPFLAAVCLGLPFGVWLLVHYGTRRLRPGPVALAAGSVLLAAAFVFTPYLELRSTWEAFHRESQTFIGWGALSPPSLVGWSGALLLAAGILLPRRRLLSGISGDPRWALLAGALLVAVLSTGGVASSPNAYDLAARVVPGLDAVRLPLRMAAGVHLVLCLLAGLGAAGLLRRLPRRAGAVAAAALLAVVLVDTLRPRVLGLEPAFAFEGFEVRPPAEDLAFFRELERRGPPGPIFEAPTPTAAHPGFGVQSSRVLLSAWHHRPTSGCLSSFVSPHREELAALSRRLPHPDAVRALRELGFTTLVVHRGRLLLPGSLALRVAASAERPGSPLRWIHGNDHMVAYALRPPTEEPPRRGSGGAGS